MQECGLSGKVLEGRTKLRSYYLWCGGKESRKVVAGGRGSPLDATLLCRPPRCPQYTRVFPHSLTLPTPRCPKPVTSLSPDVTSEKRRCRWARAHASLSSPSPSPGSCCPFSVGSGMDTRGRSEAVTPTPRSAS